MHAGKVEQICGRAEVLLLLAVLVSTLVVCITPATATASTTASLACNNTQALITDVSRRLCSEIRGRCLTQTGNATLFDKATEPYTTAYNETPAIVVQPSNEEDVVKAVAYVSNTRCPFRVRSGGHSYVDYSLVRGGIVIELSLMNDIIVNADGSANNSPRNHHQRHILDAPAVDGPTVYYETGARWGELYKKAFEVGLVGIGGTCGSVGVGGLSLGGGFGYNARQFGMTIDNLIAMRVVLANGTAVTVSEQAHKDLFWALRGAGGGNFGIVTAFEAQLGGPDSLNIGVGQTCWTSRQTADILRWLGSNTTAPRTQWPDNFEAYFRVLPSSDTERALRLMQDVRVLPLPPSADEIDPASTALAQSFQGDPRYACLSWYAYMSPEKGSKIINASLEELPQPISHSYGSMRFQDLYVINEKGCEATMNQNVSAYSILVRNLTDDLVSTMDSLAWSLDSFSNTSIFVWYMGGALSSVASNATAYPWRDYLYFVDFTAFGDAAVGRFLKQARPALVQATPADHGIYANQPWRDIPDYEHAFYGTNAAKLRQLKQLYDPTALFSFPQMVHGAAKN